MLTLLNLDMEGLKSFLRPAGFDFSGEAGLYHLTGLNEKHPELGANATGKTTLWDILVWCLWGKTTRGVQGPSVETWESLGVPSTYGAETGFEVDGEGHTVIRYRQPNELRLDGNTVEQDEIDRLLGATYETFMHSALMGQFAEFFFDLKPGPKLEVFGEALQLGVWAEAGKQARKVASEADKDLRRKESELASAEGQVSELAAALKEEEELSFEWASDREERLERLRDEKDAQEREVAKVVEVRKAAVKKLRAAESKVEKYEKELGAAEIKSRKLRTKHSEASGNTRFAKGWVDQLEDELKALPKAGQACPTCTTKMTAPKRKEARAVLVVKRKKAESDWEETVDIRDEINKQLQAVVDEKSTIDGQLTEARSVEKAAIRSSIQAKADLGTAQIELDDLSEQVDDLSAEKNPHEKRVKEIRRKRTQLRATRSTLKREMKDLAVVISAGQFWGDGFKDLRLWIVDEALLDLEVTTNSAVHALGLRGWSITFDVERPKADGKGTTKGFNVFVTSPDSDGPVPWESWSGGETQRLRIAGALGFADLIASRTGFRCNVEVWDEPTAHLSAEGITDLLGFLSSRAQDTGKEVWLVDHRSLDFPFDGRVTVACDENGSRFV